MNLYGIGSELPIARSGSTFDERIFRFGTFPKYESCASAAEWKVAARTRSTPSAASRERISPAALSVKVTARICSDRNAPVATWFAIRCVIVVVLPEPAPARMQTGPRTASAASRCSGFSPPRIRCSSIRTYNRRGGAGRSRAGRVTPA